MLGTTITLALREIRRHLLRSFLTILGIVIGVAAVVTMVTLGNGATAAVKEQISSLGSNLLMVRPGQRMGPGGGGESPPSFKPEDVEAIREQISGLRAVAAPAQSSGVAFRNAQNWSTSINGTTNDYFVAHKWQIESGRYFTSADTQTCNTVCIIGNTIGPTLYPGSDHVRSLLRHSTT